MSAMRSILSCFVLGLSLAAPLRAENVTIFAASSLKGALDAVISTSDLDARVAYGGSAAMARQIAQGAAADIVILAHPKWMDWLGEAGHISQSSRCDLIGNRLVIAGASDAATFTPTSGQDIVDRLQGGRLATGNLKSVPSGQYARGFLQRKGWLQTLRPHLAQTSNVRMALALVARGETPLGFVYASDVAAEPRVRSLFEIPEIEADKIRYPMALTHSAGPDATQVMKAITAGQNLFKEHGFKVLNHDDADRCS